jgi:cytoskeletal protein RodZ
MQPTIGEQLKQARLEQKLTIKKASQATAVRAQFLEALEADEFALLPSPVQARGFLRIYASYLGMDANQLVAAFRGETHQELAIEAEGDSTAFINSQLDQSNSIETPLEQTSPEPDESGLQFEIITPSVYLYISVDNEELPDLPLEKTGSPSPISISIFIEIGQQLKARRELLSLTLDEIERHTHIRKHHIIALEAGAIEYLPSTVQARGILSSYARFLDLDNDALLLRFAEGLQAKRNERYPYRPNPHSSPDGNNPPILPPGLRRILSTDLVFGGGMILAMVVFAVWGATRIISQREQAIGNSNSGQSISEALLAATLVTEEPTSQPTASLELLVPPGNVVVTPTTIEIPTIAKSAPVQVITAITGNTWMRVTVDGKIEFQGRVVAGSAYTYDGDETVGILTADGSLVQIVYNQTELGPMGNPGEITEMIYTPKEVLLPTPTPTNTPTRTPRTTPTYTPSITPLPVNTSEPIR